MIVTGRHIKRALCGWLISNLALAPWGSSIAAPTILSDAPIFATKKVPPNLMLDLSVEWPTGVVAAYNDNPSSEAGYECSGRDSGIGVCYFDSRTYLGLFDSRLCYDYVGTPGTATAAPSAPSTSSGYFTPVATAGGTYSHQCSGKWSGNYLNWATMQAIDTFRWALTGGDRVVDTSGTTITEKARHSGQGGYTQFPIKRVRTSSFTANSVTVPAVNPSTVAASPFNAVTTLYSRVHNNTSPFIDFHGGSTWVAPQVQFDTSSNFNTTSRKTYFVRVETCNTLYSSPNCEKYGSSWKPTGLIQQNSDRMRFGVFGYLLDSNVSRAGGVMRAKLKDVGPDTIDPINPPVANSRKEFSSTDGTFIANPDTTDATASGVSKSGVINYLNKFGKASSKYKSYDTISELYYESLRYLKNMGAATPGYISGITAAMRDGFPTITTWDDPVQYSCQKNYVMMIADVNAWCDYALPGTSITTGCSGHPTGVTNPIPGLSVTTQTNKVGTLDNSAGWSTTGYSNLATRLAPIGTGRGNTWYLAGLAYWANTNDLRPDKTIGTGDRVTVQTYMVDVAETGSWYVNRTTGQAINQMWLAALYGGFKDINANGIPANQQTWDNNSDNVPDNYFLASRPDKLVSSLNSVFGSVLATTEAGAGATLISSQVQNGDSIFEVQYSSDGWVGDVFGSTITFDTLGNPTVTPSWSARPLLDTLVTGSGWDTNRKIATRNTDTNSGVPFRLASLATAQQSSLGATATVQQEVLNWLRGDRSKEGNPYRVRKGLLGDIVSAEAVPVAAPQATYGDATNAGYSAFKTANASRPKMVYAAANDGMLHALDGNTGTEIYAYVPSFLFQGPSIPPQPGDNGLAALSQSVYTHRFYVDSTPIVGDVDFARTGGATGSGDWRTILVGGLGKGGKGYYALDITSPTAASEAAVAGKLLWEFTDPDMGFTYGKPVITKLEKHGWVVIVTSGMNNFDGTNKGQGFLYILNAKTGALLDKIPTGAGTSTNPSGFSHISAYASSFTDATASHVYGGDLLGNVWRFDLTGTPSSYSPPTLIAQLRDPSGNPQLVTTVPRIEQSLDGVTRWVFIGTGKLLDNTDMGNSQIQTMYAFKDGTISSPAPTSPLPSGVTFPLQRSYFVPISDTDLLTGVSVPANKIGWYHDMTGVGPSSSTERLAFDPVANAGVIAWVGNIPSADPCAPGVTARTYAVKYESGKSTLVNSPGSSMIVPYVASSYGLVKIQYIKVNNRVQLLASDRTRKVSQIPSESAGGSGPPRRTNWRKIIN